MKCVEPRVIIGAREDTLTENGPPVKSLDVAGSSMYNQATTLTVRPGGDHP
jgi:hypothetical protein